MTIVDPHMRDFSHVGVDRDSSRVYIDIDHIVGDIVRFVSKGRE